MKNFRTGIFETNSSSSHSISIEPCTDGLYETLTPDDDGVLELTGGEFGWEECSYYDAHTKANYAAVFSKDVAPLREMLVELLKEHTGAREVKFNFSTDFNSDNWSYIDHQSAYGEGGAALEAFRNKQNLKDWIFNPKSELRTDNDNH